MNIITTLHDPEEKLLTMVNSYSLILKKLSGKVIVACTKSTSPQMIDKLKELDFEVVSGGEYGSGRLNALKTASKKGKDEIFFCCDFDKILHWIKVESEEFIEMINKKDVDDFQLLGRSEKINSSYPKSWRSTESVVNSFFSKVYGKKADVMNGTFVFNKKSAKVILNYAKETGWGACIEWPTLILKNKLKLRYKYAKGLSWEDPDRNQKEIENSGYTNWLESTYNSKKEWLKRFNIAADQLRVLDNHFSG